MLRSKWSKINQKKNKLLKEGHLRARRARSQEAFITVKSIYITKQAIMQVKV